MPIELVAQGPTARGLVARPAARRRSGLVFCAQLAAIVVVAGLTVALASLPSSSIAGSAQEVVAGP